jgi:hypothetical protein
VTENTKVFLFDLVVPEDVGSVEGSLPVVPGKLCDKF